MEDYKPNSHKFNAEKKESRNDEKKFDKIVSGKAKTKKKNGFAEVFISEDASNVKNYLVMDVLLPAIKNTIEDIVINGVRMILRGNTSDRRSGSSSKISYNRFYNDRRDDRPGDHRTRTGYSYDDVILETRGEAEDVLTRLDEAIEVYGIVSVADLYDLVGITGNYTDNNYGWTNLRNAEAIRVREGYMLKLPKALPIK